MRQFQRICQTAGFIGTTQRRPLCCSG